MANEEITLTFREAMNELSAIVEALESNTLELEESLVNNEQRGRASALPEIKPRGSAAKGRGAHGRARYEHRRYANRHRTFQGLIPPDRCGCSVRVACAPSTQSPIKPSHVKKPSKVRTYNYSKAFGRSFVENPRYQCRIFVAQVSTRRSQFQ